MSHKGYLGAESTNERLGSRLFDSSCEREGPFLGVNSLRISETPSVSLQAVLTSAVHFCQAEMQGSWNHQNCGGCWLQHSWSWEKDAYSSSLTWLFLSLFLSPSEADRVEAVEQQGRKKGDSNCLFHIRGQFFSVPLQLEEHLSTLTSASHSSAAFG